MDSVIHPSNTWGLMRQQPAEVKMHSEFSILSNASSVLFGLAAYIVKLINLIPVEDAVLFPPFCSFPKLAKEGSRFPVQHCKGSKSTFDNVCSTTAAATRYVQQIMQFFSD